MAGFGGNWRDQPPNSATYTGCVVHSTGFAALVAGNVAHRFGGLVPTRSRLGLAACFLSLTGGQKGQTRRSEARTRGRELSCGRILGIGCGFFALSCRLLGLACGYFVLQRGGEVLRNGTEVLRSDIEVRRNSIEVLRNGIEVRRNGVEVLRSDIEVRRNGGEVLRSGIKVLSDGGEVPGYGFLVLRCGSLGPPSGAGASHCRSEVRSHGFRKPSYMNSSRRV